MPSTSTFVTPPGSAIVVDSLGQVWFLDTGDGLWKIATHGALIRVGGNRFHWMTLDQDNRCSLAHFFGDCVVSTASVDQKNFRNGLDSGHTWSNVSPSYRTPPFIT